MSTDNGSADNGNTNNGSAPHWWEQPFYSGKVRDLFRSPDGSLVMVTSDRLSAFDVVMDEPIPNKGRVLTAMTAFWFEELEGVVHSHLLSTDASTLGTVPDDWVGRTMVCRPAEMLPVECIVRGYLTGSAWREYRERGTVHGQRLPNGLREADRLPEPLFTPSTKAVEGHDENISFDKAVEILGGELAERVREVALDIYTLAAARTEAAGILLADTKFEFGLIGAQLALCDEVLTPDSSRFWPADQWNPGTNPPSFDKQPVRDFLAATGWDKSPPPPPLPAEVVTSTRDRYRFAYEAITGLSLADWPGVNLADG